MKYNAPETNLSLPNISSNLENYPYPNMYIPKNLHVGTYKIIEAINKENTKLVRLCDSWVNKYKNDLHIISKELSDNNIGRFCISYNSLYVKIISTAEEYATDYITYYIPNESNYTGLFINKAQELHDINFELKSFEAIYIDDDMIGYIATFYNKNGR